jgi:hypothetical protein
MEMVDIREGERVKTMNRRLNAVATTLGAGAATGLLAAAFFPEALVLAGAATVGLVAGAFANVRTKM